MRTARVLVPALLCCCLGGGRAQESRNTGAPIRLRRPIALVLLDDGKRLLIANRDSGTLQELDTDTSKIVAETRIGRKLSDLVRHRDMLLATDEEAGQAILLERKNGTLTVVRRIDVGVSPVGV